VFAWLGGIANRPRSGEVINRNPAEIDWQWLLPLPADLSPAAVIA